MTEKTSEKMTIDVEAWRLVTQATQAFNEAAAALTAAVAGLGEAIGPAADLQAAHRPEPGNYPMHRDVHGRLPIGWVRATDLARGDHTSDWIINARIPPEVMLGLRLDADEVAFRVTHRLHQGRMVERYGRTAIVPVYATAATTPASLFRTRFLAVRGADGLVHER